MAMIILTAFQPTDTKTGHIYKVDVEVAEDLSRMAIDHYTRNGDPVYKGETEFELFSLEQTEDILSRLDGIMTEGLSLSSMGHEAAKSSASNMLGNVASTSIGKTKMPYFPKGKIKKLKVEADEFYELEFDFIYGGGQGRTIVMDKIKALASIKFKVKMRVSAFDAKGNELWEKEEEFRDFSEVFGGQGVTFEVGEKWFELDRTPILGNGEREKIGDKGSAKIMEDEYWPLSLEEIDACMEVALIQILQSR